MHLTDYETSLHLVKRVENRNVIHAYTDRIEALTNMQYFDKVHRQSPSKEAYEAIHACVGEKLTKSEKDKILHDVTKRFKRSKTVDVKHILSNYFYHEGIRTKKERFTILHKLTKNHVSELFDLPVETVDKSTKLYAEKQGGRLAGIMMKSGDSS